jgi:O-antigen/teichoic acid export membrane protein
MQVQRLRSRLTAPGASDHLRAVGGTSVSLLAEQVLLGVAGVLAARALGPTGRGVVTAVLAWPLLLGWLSLIGINTAASVRHGGGRRDGLPTTLGNALVHSVVVGSVVAIAAIAVIPPALAHLGGDASELAVWALATIPVLVLSNIIMCVDVALGRVSLANWCRVVNPLLILVGTLFLLIRHAVTPGRIVALTITGGIVALVLAASGLPWSRIALSARGLRSDLAFGAKAHVAGLLGLANVRLDLLLMSAFVSSAQVGYYGVANNMMVPVGLLAAAASQLITPRVAGMSRTDNRLGADEAQLASIRGGARRYLLVGIGAGAAVAAAAPIAVPLLFGRAFDPVVTLVWVLTPGCVARTYATMTSAGTLGVRRPWVGNVTEGVGLLVTAALLPILLPRYDALGAAITSTAAYCASALAAAFAMRRLARQSRASSHSTVVDHADLGSSHPAIASPGAG